MWRRSSTRQNPRPFVRSTWRNNLGSSWSTRDWVATSIRLRPSSSSFVRLMRTARIPTSLTLARQCPLLHQEKKTVPDLNEFTGKNKDYFSWRDSAVNDLGKAGLICFTNDPSTVTKHLEMATSVFYALRAALLNGTASNFATALYDANMCSPLDLWRIIEQWYDTLVNRANVVLFEVKKMLSLCLDPDVVPTKFIADFNECLLRLKKNKAGLATDMDMLRVLLLVAIQDEQFRIR